MTSKMKPSKETLLNSYIDVKGWSEEDVKKAAEWLAENTGAVISEEDLRVWPDLGYHFLIADRRDNTVWVADKVDVAFKEQLTNLSFMHTNEEEPTNTLESLKKAKQELSFAKDCLKASQEAVKEAQASYTEACKAFKEEADGLLREDEETLDILSDEGSGEGSEDGCEEFVAYYRPCTAVALEKTLTEGFDYDITRVGEEYRFYDDEGDINIIRDAFSFTRLFQRVE